MIKTFTHSLIETCCNKFLQLDPQTIARLQQFSGKIVLIDMPAWKIKFFLLITDQGIQLLNNDEMIADTTIKGSPLTLLRISKSQETQFDDVVIEGDLELGQQIRDILRSMDIDWEEQLSKITGDVIAHQMGSMTNKVLRWLKQSSNTFATDISEYLQEEARYLPAGLEVEEFIDSVNKIRHDVERLEKRMDLIFKE